MNPINRLYLKQFLFGLASITCLFIGVVINNVWPLLSFAVLAASLWLIYKFNSMMKPINAAKKEQLRSIIDPDGTQDPVQVQKAIDLFNLD